ncbi:unnamed protein product [Adineta steineri]|nr:unnamed protein product [Adineta steineri]CAF3546346.1 unnamed protein product [Adineta steineri]
MANAGGGVGSTPDLHVNVLIQLAMVGFYIPVASVSGLDFKNKDIMCRLLNQVFHIGIYYSSSKLHF